MNPTPNHAGSASRSTPARKSNVTVYNRLVRDKMPEIIESMGNIAVCRALDEQTFGQMLLETMARSANQFAESTSMESLADLLDCLDAWLEVHGLTMEDVERARTERTKRCGAYQNRTFLERVADGSSADSLPLRDFHC